MKLLTDRRQCREIKKLQNNDTLRTQNKIVFGAQNVVFEKDKHNTYCDLLFPSMGIRKLFL